MVNAIPAIAKLESYVRGASFEAILKENRKVNRALIGAALSLGANIEISDFCGYAPHYNDARLEDIVEEAMSEVLPEEVFSRCDKMGTGSSDIGDLCSVMPVVHPYAPGATGIAHGNNYYLVDAERACVGSAKLQVAMLFLLLENNAIRAREVIENYQPRFASIKEYLDFVDAICTSGDRITYTEDGVQIKL